jgi:hypothetical protein
MCAEIDMSITKKRRKLDLNSHEMGQGAHPGQGNGRGNIEQAVDGDKQVVREGGKADPVHRGQRPSAFHCNRPKKQADQRQIKSYEPNSGGEGIHM